ncbi:hypothetical protein CEXT_112971 [Caerostris extrusa]|uniref:Uncharacterized protein n=1 Tax=Caerostris extrusa TaxID=172846 RepID=A0AAV4Q7Z8_CAEEX|nr:hypothetical protein CEXT_112971 [Caerostris extrusa]
MEAFPLSQGGRKEEKQAGRSAEDEQKEEEPFTHPPKLRDSEVDEPKPSRPESEFLSPPNKSSHSNGKHGIVAGPRTTLSFTPDSS